MLEVDQQELAEQYVDIRPMAIYEHRKGATNIDAWVKTILRVESRQAAVKRNHPTGALRKVLIRYASISGLTSSGVEQGFATLARHLTPHRGREH